MTLTQQEFIFQGGEGSVYGKGDTAYKIYTDLKKIIPEAKIRELKIISCDAVILPKEILLDNKGRYAGFTMKWVKESVPLVKLFTKEFKKRNRITTGVSP